MGMLHIYWGLTATTGLKWPCSPAFDNVNNATLAQVLTVVYCNDHFHMFPDNTLMVSSSLQQIHIPLHASSHNVIVWMEEVGTMTFNNYLAQIIFPYLSHCKFCLHCFRSLWVIDTSSLLFVQVMLIVIGHSPGVHLPRQLGQWVSKQSSPRGWRTGRLNTSTTSHDCGLK